MFTYQERDRTRSVSPPPSLSAAACRSITLPEAFLFGSQYDPRRFRRQLEGKACNNRRLHMSTCNPIRWPVV